MHRSQVDRPERIGGHLGAESGAAVLQCRGAAGCGGWKCVWEVWDGAGRGERVHVFDIFEAE